MKFITTILSIGLLATSGLAKDVDWEHNYDTALEKAKKDKKLVMIDIYTDWCGWCKKLDKDVYSDKDVQAKLAKDFIAVKLNPEKSSKNEKISRGFGTRGFPHIVFTDADGKQLSDVGGYQPAETFLKTLEGVTKKAAAK